MFAPSLDHPVNNMCFYFTKTEIGLDFKCVFLPMLTYEMSTFLYDSKAK